MRSVEHVVISAVTKQDYLFALSNALGPSDTRHKSLPSYPRRPKPPKRLKISGASGLLLYEYAPYLYVYYLTLHA